MHIIPAKARALHGLYGAENARLFLVRPDGHVAFAGTPGDLGSLVTHLDGLFRGRQERDRGVDGLVVARG